MKQLDSVFNTLTHAMFSNIMGKCHNEETDCWTLDIRKHGVYTFSYYSSSYLQL